MELEHSGVILVTMVESSILLHFSGYSPPTHNQKNLAKVGYKQDMKVLKKIEASIYARISMGYLFMFQLISEGVVPTTIFKMKFIFFSEGAI